MVSQKCPQPPAAVFPMRAARGKRTIRESQVTVHPRLRVNPGRIWRFIDMGVFVKYLFLQS
jgi:hypothetical protein